jgi:AAA domain
MFGEDEVYDFFAEHLEGWEIYRQPHVNGKRPDLALLNPEVGLGIFEVKDWHLSAGGWREYRDAIEQAKSYSELFGSIFSPRFNQRMEFPLTVGLIFTRASDAEVQLHFSKFLNGTPYTTICGRDTLSGGYVERIFPLALRRSPTRLTDDAANDLRNWLLPPHHAIEHAKRLDDDPRQKPFVNNPDRIKRRRMKGSAGAGKSVTLVRRAAKVAAEGKDVLFVYYNNALTNYLRDICERTGDAHPKQINWRTFHGHCSKMAAEIGLRDKFAELRRNKANFDEVIPATILDTLRDLNLRFKKFDAIYVDEGQDFNLSWWNVLLRCLRDSGEIMIAFDTAQQIYPRTDWNAESLPGAGFSGPWIKLDASRRLPPCLLPLLRSFAERFHPVALNSIPEDPAAPDHPCSLRWVQVKPEARVPTAVNELMRIIQHDPPPVSRSITDLTLLCDLRNDCAEAAASLAERGVLVTSTLAEGDDKGQTTKRFTMRTSRVKISTFHSFKGWQSRLIVLSVSKLDAASLYTVLTRVKNHPQGSNLTVVSSPPQLKEFGATFPDFESRA